MANGIQNLRDFIESVIAARPDAHPAAASAEDFEEMRQHVLGLYAGVEEQHSFIELGGAVVDCIPIEQQPSLRNTGRGAEPAPRPPPFDLPAEAMARAGHAFQPARQLDPDYKDRHGNAMWCPQGTIPMRRITLDDVTRFGTLRSFHSKAPGGGQHPRFGGPTTVVHKYATARQDVNNDGGASAISLAKPATGNTASDFSLSQQWWSAGTGTNLQTVETGWQVYPFKYNTTMPCLFIYWTPDGYQTGCYNLDCSAFVQTSNLYVLGGALPWTPTPFLTVMWTLWHLFSDNWNLFMVSLSGGDYERIGYYPASKFGTGLMRSGAADCEFGGETIGETSWPPMGTGILPPTPLAASQVVITYYQGVDSFRANLTPSQPSPVCYKILVHEDIYTWIEFGGPGGTNC